MWSHQQSFKAGSKLMMKWDRDEAVYTQQWKELLSQPHLGKFTQMFRQWDGAALSAAAVQAVIRCLTLPSVADM